MSDKYAALRPIRRRQCNRADGMPKKRYSRAQAEAKAAETPGYNAYRCKHCEFWHVGTRLRPAEIARLAASRKDTP